MNKLDMWLANGAAERIERALILAPEPSLHDARHALMNHLYKLLCVAAERETEWVFCYHRWYHRIARRARKANRKFEHAHTALVKAAMEAMA